MFDFSCSETLLMNWCLHQVSNHPDAVFPCRKGWRSYLNLYYPENGDHCYFLAAMATQNECVAFIALDDTYVDDQIGKIKPCQLKAYIQNHLRQTFHSFQLIFLTCERLQSQIGAILLNKRNKAALLVMRSDQMGFHKGQFENSLYGFRLNKQTLDPDLIPAQIPANYAKIENGHEKAIYYLSLFHQLNHYWISGIQGIGLDKLLSAAIPYWSQYKKKHRKKLRSQIAAELNSFLNQFFPDLISFQSPQKKPCSHPVDTIVFRSKISDQKTFRQWVKTESDAIQWIHHHFQKTPIDMLTLIEDAQKKTNDSIFSGS